MLSKNEIEKLLSHRYVSDEDFLRLGRDAVPILIDIFQNDRSEWRDARRRMALHALGLLGGDRAADFLIATAEDSGEEGWLRKAAIRSSGYTNHPRSFDFLKATLEHADYDFRKSAALALTHSTDPRAAEILETLQESGEPRLSEKLSQIAEAQQSALEAEDLPRSEKV
jgi:HEAT repeat protein